MKLFCVAFLPILLGSSVIAQHRYEPPKRSTKRVSDSQKFRSPFRYLIVADVTELEKYVNENKEFRVIQVLMDDREFNEKNLRILFELLSTRFNDRPGLMVNVYTSLDQIKTPEEQDHSDLFNSPVGYDRYKFAVFNRRRNCEQEFEYSIPGRGSRRVPMEPCGRMSPK